MGLITEGTIPVFDLTQVREGCLMRARHRSWDRFRNGIVTRAEEKKIIVQHLASAGMATNHYVIPAAEAAAGEWMILWTEDMEEVSRYPGTEVGWAENA